MTFEMPAAAPSQKAQLKRKTSKSERGSSKRLRVETDEDDVQAQLLDLEKGILGSRKNYNDISTLIKHAKSKDDEVLSFSAAVALCRVFMSLMAADELQTKQSQSEKDAIVARWLRERYAEFKEILLQLLNTHANPSDVLTLCMRLLKSEAAGLKQGSEYTFPAVFLSEIVRKVLDSEDDEELRDIFCEKYLIEYHDIRFYTFSAIEYVYSIPYLILTDTQQHPTF
jgi:U3 small nucleolar RNA-associated protein 19